MTTARFSYIMERWNETGQRDLAPPLKATLTDAGGRFEGDLSGAASSLLLLSYLTPTDGCFCGYTFFEGRLDGRQGGFVMRDAGQFDPVSARTQWRILDGSGHGELAGISGSGHYSAAHGNFKIDAELLYGFDEKTISDAMPKKSEQTNIGKYS